MLSTLRTHVHRPCLRPLALWLLASLVFAFVSSSCPMPFWSVASPAVHAAGCADLTHIASPHENKDAPAPSQRCFLKPCLSLQSAAWTSAKPDGLESAAAFVGLAWVSTRLPRRAPPGRIRAGSPPPGRRVPLFFRFCALLN